MYSSRGPLPSRRFYAAWSCGRAWQSRPEGRLPLGVGVRPCREAQSQKKTLIAAEQDRPDVARRRAQWAKYQDRIDPSRLVFIDETWTKTNMAPLRGWAPRGQRTDQRRAFPALCRQGSRPHPQAGDIVIMDNLGSHKGKAVRRAIRSAGARLFLLPKYSPDLNPIEKFSALSPQPNAETTSSRPALRQPKFIPL